MIATPEMIAEAIRILRAGEVVGFPTETVYGLGADALRAEAVERVFSLKGRPRRNPLIVHVSGEEMARGLCAAWSSEESRLARAFWPGPLTIVADALDLVPPAVRAGGPTVAIRCPEHPLTLALIEAFGSPIVGPSANLSGAVSPTTAEHVRAAFPGLFVLDGGACQGGIESTVVRVARDAVDVLRPGLVAPEAIEDLLGRPVARAWTQAAGEGSLPSPGLLARHYAPRCAARLVTREEIESARGERLVVLATSEVAPSDERQVISMPRSAREYAGALYAALRAADARAPDAILIERPPVDFGSADERAVWAAILDRLTRATS